MLYWLTRLITSAGYWQLLRSLQKLIQSVAETQIRPLLNFDVLIFAFVLLLLRLVLVNSLEIRNDKLVDFFEEFRFLKFENKQSSRVLFCTVNLTAYADRRSMNASSLTESLFQSLFVIRLWQLFLEIQSFRLIDYNRLIIEIHFD